MFSGVFRKCLDLFLSTDKIMKEDSSLNTPWRYNSVSFSRSDYEDQFHLNCISDYDYVKHCLMTLNPCWWFKRWCKWCQWTSVEILKRCFMIQMFPLEFKSSVVTTGFEAKCLRQGRKSEIQRWTNTLLVFVSFCGISWQ